MKYSILLISLLLVLVSHTSAQTPRPVQVREEPDHFWMGNGIVETKILKRSGSVSSIKFRGAELLGHGRESGEYAMWSHDAVSPDMIYKVTIDPATNGGERAEISVKGISKGRPMGSGPGGPFIADIEIRWAIERGQPGIYTYTIFDHLPEYPASSMGEARFVAFLNKDFDWMSVDEKRSKLYRLRDGELDLSKYQYTANLHENPVFGWINTSTKTGFWLVNASMEYMSGGPTKVDFLCHRDTRVNGLPVFLNYWRSSHYGGSSVEVVEGEKWAKLIGPIFLYANTGSDIQTIKRNALEQQKAEAAKFPYAWAKAAEFPLREDRGTVSGKLVLKDPVTKKLGRLRVGLTAPDYYVSQPNTTEKRLVDWQWDAKNYQFWAEGSQNGEFTIRNIRPGKYTLHAISDGVLGEFVKTDITIERGGKIDLGSLAWTPVRRGRQIWEIGVANRNGSEFLGGERWYENDILKQYPRNFPNDVKYTIGKSDFRKDWFYVQVPHVENFESAENNRLPAQTQEVFTRGVAANMATPEGKALIMETFTTMGSSGKYARGRETTWTINFELKDRLKSAVLRLAICGNGAKEIIVSVNDKPAGTVANLRIDGTPNRSGNHGLWNEREVAIDGTLLANGMNTIKLTIPGGQVVAGVLYDYLRLEAVE